MQISIAPDLRPTINGQTIDTAPSVPALHALLGTPSRISEGKTPAPPGHRNNQIHIYDEVGAYFYEHHYTRRISGCKVLFCAEKGEPFGTRSYYRGVVTIAGKRLSAQTNLAQFLSECPIVFERTLDWLRAEQGQFSVILSSGNIALSWPHDPWGQSAGE